MREAYKALHDLAAQLSQKTEIDLHFYPPTFDVEDTCYVVTDVFGLIAQLQKLRDLPDSFDECYDRIVKPSAIRLSPIRHPASSADSWNGRRAPGIESLTPTPTGLVELHNGL